MNWSIERKLPLFVTILLVAVAIAQLTIGYGEVRQASRALVDKRLPLATRVLADLFQIPTQRARITALAKDPAIVAFLRSREPADRARALVAMQRITNDTSSTGSLELRDFGGKLLLRTGKFTAADSVLVSPRSDSATYGPFMRQDTTLFIAVTMAVGALTPSVYLDIIFVKVGRAVNSFSFVDALSPFDATLRDSLIAASARRMQTN